MVGTQVRLRLTDEEALRIASGSGDLRRSYEGEVVRASSDSVSLLISTMRVETALGSEQMRSMRTFSVGGVESASRRSLSWGRTALAAVGGAGALAGIVIARMRTRTGGSGGDGGGPTPPPAGFAARLSIQAR